MSNNNEFSTTLALQNTLGWHMRPAGLLVKVASMFESEIMVKCGRKIASAKSLLGVLTIGASNGARLCVSARGHDAYLAIKAISDKYSADPDSGVTACDTLPLAASQEVTNGAAGKKEKRVKEGAPAAKPSKPKGLVSTAFKCDLKPEAKSVFLVGDFNNWDPKAEPMTKRGGQFSKSIKLAPGQYQYKYVIDGEWHLDPAAPTTGSPLGSINNVIIV